MDGDPMGFLDGLSRLFSRTAAQSVVDEMSMTPTQKKVRELQKQTSIPLDPNYYEVLSEEEANAYRDECRQDEEQGVSDLHDAANEIVNRAYFYQNEYIRGSILKVEFESILIELLEQLRIDITTSAIVGTFTVDWRKKSIIYELYKKDLDELLLNWLPNH